MNYFNTILLTGLLSSISSALATSNNYDTLDNLSEKTQEKRLNEKRNLLLNKFFETDPDYEDLLKRRKKILADLRLVSFNIYSASNDDKPQMSKEDLEKNLVKVDVLLKKLLKKAIKELPPGLRTFKEISEHTEALIGKVEWVRQELDEYLEKDKKREEKLSEITEERKQMSQEIDQELKDKREDNRRYQEELLAQEKELEDIDKDVKNFQSNRVYALPPKEKQGWGIASKISMGVGAVGALFTSVVGLYKYTYSSVSNSDTTKTDDLQ